MVHKLHLQASEKWVLFGPSLHKHQPLFCNQLLEIMSIMRSKLEGEITERDQCVAYALNTRL